ncbi:twin-arginine translocation pathway signal [Amycolatopsis acidicola]|uniref:Twin-arginine translocation pathway signal n=1 Tax=Amycolatopsis acidicola TaxID=2596893 RepID=A0A5N0VBA1_9PSEU|nr:twin-arginine translocation pathway signal [Amycolatopsis acidicola]KAA9163659.1 twin-arginine translocation pathway signal [Amycolatopsis acidicola]
MKKLLVLPARLWRWVRRAPAAFFRRATRVSVRKRRVGFALLTVLTLVAVAGATVLFFAQRRAEAITSARFDAVAQARLKVAEVLSYKADTIDSDIDRARQDTAGTFAEYYVPFAQQAIAPAVKQEGTSSVAIVSRAAAVSADAGTVVVVVFIDQRTSSKAQPDPRATSSTARVTMTKVAGTWLISELTPTSS